MDKSQFDTIWERSRELTPRAPATCAHAEVFDKWVIERLEIAVVEPTIVGLNQAKILLLDKYFEWRSCVGEPHRSLLSRSGHRCIFQVFADSYTRLKAAELALAPPRLWEPVAPPPPPPMPARPPRQVGGICIGEEDE